MKSIAVLFLCLAAVALTASLPPPLQRNQVGGIACSACQIMVGTAENLLVGNHTETEVINTMEQFCTNDIDKLFPDIGLGKTCTEFVDTYLKAAIDKLLQDYLTPEEVCKDLTLC